MSLVYNVAAFGLFPNKIRNLIKIRHDCIGADHLYIAEASLHGDIIVEPSAMIYTRRAEGADNWGTYIKKHISDNILPQDIVADFEKQLEWVCHINELAFANYPEVMKNISLASSLGSYFTRYGASHLGAVSGALEMWLNSDSGRIIASQMNSIGSVIKAKISG
jgi:hypothetical protein